MTGATSPLESALSDRYRIEREIGGGGMSRVFLATETALGREVVIKAIKPDLAEGLSAERFAREVKLAARLQQANIVPVLSAGDADGVPWYTMPYVRGESLRARLARGDAVPLPQAVSILRDVARALEYAHSEKVVHRDIKPENILLSGSTAVVTDFGIAKALATSRTQDGAGASGTLTSVGSAIGTPAYMAPEQVAGDPPADHRADLYAWGVVAWELLAGRHPFASAASAQALMAAHLAQPAPDLAAVREGVPPALADLVRRCLEKDPSRRPSSAAELLASLDEVTTPVPVTAAPGRLPRRRWQLVSIGVAIVAITLAAVWRLGARPTAAIPERAFKSIAVLPFESQGGDTANVYFAEGMADELTTALASVDGLRVAATSSAFTYRGKTVDPREAGRALNVSAVLQGRIRRAGSVLRVSAQLTNAADGLVLWSRSYDRDAKDVFAVQDELVREIVGALRITLTGGTGTTAMRGTRDVEAYDLYLRGLYFLNQRGPGVAKSIPYFRQAISRDSTFARAWAQLGTAYGFLSIFDLVAPDTTLREARAAIARSLQLDSLSAEAHAASGLVLALNSQWEPALAEYQQAIELDPSYAVVYRLSLSTLAMLGREADARAASRILMERDPLSAVSSSVISMVELNFGHRDDALASARRAVELDSTGAMPRAQLAAAELAAGHPDSARAHAARAAHTPNTAPWIGWVLGATGDRTSTANLIREVEAQGRRNAAAGVTIASAALGAGDTTAALDALERAARDGEALGFMAPFGLPMYDPLRGSARFSAIVRAFGADPSVFTRPTGARP
jgi:serine/threonine-protein kinase